MIEDVFNVINGIVWTDADRKFYDPHITVRYTVKATSGTTRYAF